MVFPLVAAGGAALVVKGGLSAGTIYGLVAGGGVAVTGSAYGAWNYFFGCDDDTIDDNASDKAKHQASLKKQGQQAEQRRQGSRQSKDLAHSKVEQTSTALNTTNQNKSDVCKTVESAGKNLSKTGHSLLSVSSTAYDSSKELSQSLPEMQKNTDITKKHNNELLKEIERLNTLLQDKTKAFEQANQGMGELNNSLTEQAKEINQLRGSIQSLKEKVASLTGQNKEMTDKIDELSAKLRRSNRNLNLFKAIYEKDKNSSETQERTNNSLKI